MDMTIPPGKIKILLESNPLKCRIVVRRLAAASGRGAHSGRGVPQGVRLRRLILELAMGILPVSVKNTPSVLEFRALHLEHM